MYLFSFRWKPWGRWREKRCLTPIFPWTEYSGLHGNGPFLPLNQMMIPRGLKDTEEEKDTTNLPSLEGKRFLQRCTNSLWGNSPILNVLWRTANCRQGSPAPDVGNLDFYLILTFDLKWTEWSVWDTPCLYADVCWMTQTRTSSKNLYLDMTMLGSECPPTKTYALFQQIRRTLICDKYIYIVCIMFCF